MIEHQMDVARLNFSWGTHEEHAYFIANIRMVAQEADKKIPIIQDLSGPRIQDEKGHRFDYVDHGEDSIITDKDLIDLRFGVEQKVDYIAMSYVGSDVDVVKLREEIKNLGAQIPIIAKIERKIAIDNLGDILLVADAIMIARGDMANEIPIEEIPFIQRKIIKAAKSAGKPVITATQMLLSMTETSTPTRAEVSDVAHAILDGSDAVMLSEETALGKYPSEAVAVMERIILEAEKHHEEMKINPL